MNMSKQLLLGIVIVFSFKICAMDQKALEKNNDQSQENNNIPRLTCLAFLKILPLYSKLPVHKQEAFKFFLKEKFSIQVAGKKEQEEQAKRDALLLNNFITLNSELNGDHAFYSVLYSSFLNKIKISETNDKEFFYNGDKVQSEKIGVVNQSCACDRAYNNAMREYLGSKLKANHIGWESEVPESEKQLEFLYKRCLGRDPVKINTTVGL